MGLAQVLRDSLPSAHDPNLLVGFDTADDAGVYRIAPDLALVQTLDFFPPLVDDPYLFGQIAAANALSDVYAMNGRPLTALNIVGFPDKELGPDVLAAILQGGHERVTAAGALIVGGHSVRDAEVKYGLSVTGLVDPRELWTNAGARPGDLLVLTKPLGTGFVTTAFKKGECPDAVLQAATASMVSLNALGRDAGRACGGVHAATDITGFGLAGHAGELARASGVTIEIDLASLPLIAGSRELVRNEFRTRATAFNREYLGEGLSVSERVDPTLLEYAFDPQTSGGLLLSVAPEAVERLLKELAARHSPAAAVVGRVVQSGNGPTLRLV